MILLYHHVSDTGPASTSVPPLRFREHLQYLQDQQFLVWPLDRVLDAVFSGQPMPDQVVAITFDDSYRNLVSQALPILREYNYPFTVFIDTAAISDDSSLRPSWADLKTLQAHGAIIANHSHTHAHLPQRLHHETDAQWQQRISGEITTAQSLLEKQLGGAPNWFAYPYGEFDGQTQAIVESLGYWGFGQHSGPIGPLSDRLALPRFAVTGQYSAMPGFIQKISTRPFPVLELRQAKPTTGAIAPLAEVLLASGNYSLEGLQCFSHNDEAASISLHNAQEFSVQAKRALPAGRSRYNCTMPAGNDRFYWLTIPWLVDQAAPEFRGATP